MKNRETIQPASGNQTQLDTPFTTVGDHWSGKLMYTLKQKLRHQPFAVVLTILAGLLVVLFASAMMVLVFFDINAYRTRIQAAATGMLGMDVTVDGSLGLGFSPGLYLTLSHVHIRNQGVRVATAPKVSLGIGLIPLLTRQVRLNHLWIEEPDISLVRDLNGHFNVGKRTSEVLMIEPLDLPEISITAGKLSYVDEQTQLLLVATDCSLNTEDAHLSQGRSSEVLKNLTMTGDLVCGHFNKNAYVGSGLSVHLHFMEGILALDPVTMRLFDGAGKGRITIKLGENAPQYQLDYSLMQLHTETFLLALNGLPMLEGLMDLEVNLKGAGNSYHQVLSSTVGQFSLHANQLTLHGCDLDKELNQIESSQDFNLIDAGAYFFVGPLGILASKSYAFAQVLNDTGGSSQIEVMVSEWKVKAGVAVAQDVAMATREHRIALQGKLDFVNEQFEDLSLAVLDHQGCADAEQKVTGSFQQPIASGTSLIKSLTSPIRALVSKSIELFVDLDCEVFYAGRVVPPV